MALCVVGPDMSRLSIDGSYLSKRGALWVQISNGTVVVIQCQGESVRLLCFLAAGVVEHT